jgi:hypothetical protein
MSKRLYSGALAAVCLLVYAGGGQAQSASVGSPAEAKPAPSVDAVNPFTGRALMLEKKQLELEEAKLEEQLAAAILSRRKFEAETRRLGAESGAPKLTAPVASEGNRFGAQAVLRRSAPGATAAASSGPRRKHALIPRALQSPAIVAPIPAPVASPTAPRVVGWAKFNGNDYALMQDQAQIRTVAVGASIGGRRIDRVLDNSVVVDGVAHAIPTGSSRVETVERRLRPIDATLRSRLPDGAAQVNPTAPGASSQPGSGNIDLEPKAWERGVQ